MRVPTYPTLIKTPQKSSQVSLFDICKHATYYYPTYGLLWSLTISTAHRLLDHFVLTGVTAAISTQSTRSAFLLTLNLSEGFDYSRDRHVCFKACVDCAREIHFFAVPPPKPQKFRVSRVDSLTSP